MGDFRLSNQRRKGSGMIEVLSNSLDWRKKRSLLLLQDIWNSNGGERGDNIISSNVWEERGGGDINSITSQGGRRKRYSFPPLMQGGS